jgi:hypothetical protein
MPYQLFKQWLLVHIPNSQITYFFYTKRPLIALIYMIIILISLYSSIIITYDFIGLGKYAYEIQFPLGKYKP